MAFRTLLFLFVAILLVSTMISAYEFEDEKVKQPKVPTSGDVQIPPLSEHEVHDDGKSHFKDWHESSDDAGSFVGNGLGRKYMYHSNYEEGASEGVSDIFHDEPLS
ncbi:hypothetical protein RchiOBHm_Chr2g0170511 [Rosa chinensis]|uniref:Uncharacterized protein n=1 Tax=Rosa chinensis TaxID=74649 RepID=A0A2P6S563_ROSCH|nr:uncharacterized protein LOC112187047 [Rosa chinensis]PRQ53802.1 hypothetical protein RchiOBHm_Chr2g0170511 [Rosa chinensis]